MSEGDVKNQKLEALFEDENLPVVPERAEPLKKLELTPSPEALSAAEKFKTQGGIEKRIFNRVETKSQLSLRFTHQEQFAKQYIENISLGGLFVRTQLKPGLGATLPIEFEVPTRQGSKAFRLLGKVRRQTESGLGIEFVDLTTEIRAELEAFVKSTLPEGTPIANQIKKASVDRLGKMREETELKKGRHQKIFRRWALAISLVILNASIAIDWIRDAEDKSVQNGARSQRDSVEVQGQKIELLRIQSVQRSAQGEIILRLNDGSLIRTDAKELQRQKLPRHFTQTLESVYSTPSRPEPKRRVKNPSRNQ
jgi:hypothetical protein